MIDIKNFENKILDFIYIVSKQPILLRDLLVANRQYNEKVHIDPAKLGFRLRLSRAYLVYLGLVLCVLVPISFIFHTTLAKIDSHISILGAMLITALIFIGFNLFRARMRDAISLVLIKKSWELHFPYFPYEEYSLKIEEIFHQAIKDEISKRDLERYILDKLSQ